VNEPGAIAVFVKTIGRSPVKTRLAAAIGPDRATEFYRRCVAATHAVVQQARLSALLAPYWAVAEAEAIHDPTWSSFSTIRQGDGALGDRLDHVYRTLLQRHPYVILLGADSPLMSAEVIALAAQMMTTASRAPFAISRSGDGGYSLFAGRVAISSDVWQAVPYSSPRTGEVFVSQLQRVGEVIELPSVDDIDTVADLRSLVRDAADAQLLREQADVMKYARRVLDDASGVG
jgi:glycosyltransferase A (GT-A) superfamily protein (DUF2064 family)